MSILSELQAAANRRPVTFALSSSESSVTGWHVREIDIDENLSGEFVAQIDLENDDQFADPALLLGIPATLTMSRAMLPPVSRNWIGVVRSVEEPFSADFAGRRHARITLEPAFACLKEEVQTRKFQELAVPDVVKEVLGQVEGGLYRNFELNLARQSDAAGGASLPYSVRDLCVQYGETTYDFLRRILAEEGIAFFFRSDEARETLVLVDEMFGFPELKSPAFLTPAHGMQADHELVHTFRTRHGRAPRTAEVRGFDPTRHVQLEARRHRTDTEALKGTGDAITYDPGTAVTLFAPDQSAYTKSDVEFQARLRLERSLTESARAEGTGDILAFAPGLVFTLDTSRLPHAPSGGKYLLTHVRHRGRNAVRRAGDAGEDSSASYSNEFACVPSNIPFRPSLLPKPRAIEDWGVVVSPSDGDPIHTDRHGRIRVRFGYDHAEGVRAELRSPWIPVPQAWAGDGFGVQIIPRAGMLVRIRYLFGDPDRPFIAGCLPTAHNVLPSKLPDDKSRLTIRSRSLRNGGHDLHHYNEITLDDAAEREEFFIRAGLNFRKEVLNDSRTDIGHDEHRTVGNFQKLEVHGGRRKVVGQNETVIIKQKRTTEVIGDDERHVHGKDTLVVDREMKLEVHGPRTTTIHGAESRHFGDGRREEVVGDDDLKVSETHSVTADEELKVMQGPTTLSFKDGDVRLKAGGSVTLAVDGATLHMKPNGEAVLQCDTRLELACGDASIVLTPDKIEVAAPEVQLTGANGAATADQTGFTITGLNVTSTALGKNELTGAFVKAN